MLRPTGPCSAPTRPSFVFAFYMILIIIMIINIIIVIIIFMIMIINQAVFCTDQTELSSDKD